MSKIRCGGKKVLLLVFCFIIFFALTSRCEAMPDGRQASSVSEEILQIANQSEQNQIAVSHILKKATEDKTTVSQTPAKLEIFSTPKTIRRDGLKQLFLGIRQGESAKVVASGDQNLRVSVNPVVLSPCNHTYFILRL